MLGSNQLRNTLSNVTVTLDGITMASSITIENLRVIFDKDMSINSHIKHILWSFLQKTSPCICYF